MNNINLHPLFCFQAIAVIVDYRSIFLFSTVGIPLFNVLVGSELENMKFDIKFSLASEATSLDAVFLGNSVRISP